MFARIFEVEGVARQEDEIAWHFAVPAAEIVFVSNHIYAGNRSLSFGELAALP